MMDIREEIIESENAFEINLRELTPADDQKIKRILADEKKILEIHPTLLLQEETFINSISSEIELMQQPPALKTRLLDFQLFGVSWMMNREKSVIRGGILADEMGLGKTLQTLGLFLSSSSHTLNLVVAPAISISQWQREMEHHSPGAFDIVVYHGRYKSNREAIQAAVQTPLAKNRVVLSTYGTIESAYRRKEKLIFDTNFERIVLDEAHCIKDSKSNACTAVSAVNAKYRWGLTGTPVQNRVGDLFSLIKFLQLDPHAYYFCKKCPCKSRKWLNYDKKDPLKDRAGFCTCGHFSASHFGWWNRRITSQVKNFGYTTKAHEIFASLKNITSHIILRRTKSKMEHELGLPSKRVGISRFYFSDQEKDFYESIFKNTQTKFMSYAVVGQIAHNYAHIFDLLQKMRLAVNHPYLAIKKVNEGIPICGYCNEEANDPIEAKCKHIFCREEAREFLQLSSVCPVCKIKISIDLNQVANFELKPSKINPDKWTSSTKIEALLEQLSNLKSSTNIQKSIVFSQFVNFLELLRWRLERAGFRCVKIYGSMNLGQRRAAIDTFNSDPNITVFLISLKAGGVALNLTEANHVFLMDLWWNPAVEEQAMDRIHRIGQYRPIKITRIIIQDSIESKILQLQEKKKALFDSAVECDVNALQRLSEDDLMFLFAN